MKRIFLVLLLVLLCAQFVQAAEAAAPTGWGNIPQLEGWVDEGDHWYDPVWEVSISKEWTPWLHEAYLQRVAISEWRTEQ